MDCAINPDLSTYTIANIIIGTYAKSFDWNINRLAQYATYTGTAPTLTAATTLATTCTTMPYY